MPFFNNGQIIPYREDYREVQGGERKVTLYDRLHNTTQAFSNGVCLASLSIGSIASSRFSLGFAVATAGLAGAAVFFAPPVAAAIGVVGKLSAAAGAAFGGLAGFSAVQAAAHFITHPSHLLKSERGYGLAVAAGVVAPLALACTVGFNTYSMAKDRIAEAKTRPSEVWNVQAKDCNSPEVQKHIANFRRLGIRATCTPQ